VAKTTNIDENAALGVALLAPGHMRQDMIDDLLDSDERSGDVQFAGFSPDSEFVPDWGEDSGSEADHVETDIGMHKEIMSKIASSASQTTDTVEISGLPLTTLKMVCGRVVPSIARGSRGFRSEKPTIDSPLDAAGDSSNPSAIVTNADSGILPHSDQLVHSADSADIGSFTSNNQMVPTTKMQANPPPQPWLVYNARGHPCAHWERVSPELAFNEADMLRLGHWCHNAEMKRADIADVVEWLHNHGVAKKLSAPMLKDFEWRTAESITGPSLLHNVGRWYRFNFHHPEPAPLQGTKISCHTKWEHPWADYRRCIHSTNLYVLPRILHQGLQVGDHVGKGGVRGVYCYEMKSESLAVKSSGYCVYTSPHKDGTFWGPRLELQVAVGLSSAKQKHIHVGERQFAAFEESYSVSALWVHLVTQEEIRTAMQAPVKLWYVTDAWRPEFVVPL